MKDKEQIITAVDVGSSKVCAVIGLVTDKKCLEVIGAGISPSQGVKKGVVVDIEQTANAVHASLETAEKMADASSPVVMVNFTGHHIKGMNSYGSVPITHDTYEVTDDDVIKVIQSANAISLPYDRVLIHSFPQDFCLDGHGGIRHPKGMSGARLEVGVHIVTGGYTFAQNLNKAINRAGLHCGELIFSGYASSQVILTEEEKEHGVVVLDIGAGTTDVVIYYGGFVKMSFVLPVGGINVTNDISVGLRLPPNKAEEIKKKYGIALRSGVAGSEEFIVPGVMGRDAQKRPIRDLAAIIEPRMEEVFQLIKQKIESEKLHEKIGSGIVLTGGGSLLRRVHDLAARVFSIPVRIGNIREVEGLDHIIESPPYTTAVGLLEAGRQLAVKQTEAGLESRKLMTAVTGWMKKWVNR